MSGFSTEKKCTQMYRWLNAATVRVAGESKPMAIAQNSRKAKAYIPLFVNRKMPAFTSGWPIHYHWSHSSVTRHARHRK